MTTKREIPSVRFAGDSPGDGHFPVQSAEQRLVEMMRDFDDPAQAWRRLFAELLGTFLLVLVAAGGPMMGKAFPGSVSRAAAVVAPGLMVMAVILFMGKVSGAHLNPVVSHVDAAFGGMAWRNAVAYALVQVTGCSTGAIVANLMFSRAAVSISTHHRNSAGHFLSEVVATLGLVVIIFALARTGRGRCAPAAVGAYIGAAYFFTSSTSFANPAIDPDRGRRCRGRSPPNGSSMSGRGS